MSDTMPNGAYRLYGRTNAGSLAVQIVFEEIGSPYEMLWFSKEPADVEKLRRVNPAAKIPVLELPDGTLIAESAAIIIHLTNTHPAAKLAPALGSSDHARFLQWMVFLSANAYEAALRYFYADRYSADGDTAAEQIKTKALADWTRHFETIHAALSPYVLGPDISAADPYLHMLSTWYPWDDAALAARLPKLKAHAELMRRRPATVKAEADHADR